MPSANRRPGIRVSDGLAIVVLQVAFVFPLLPLKEKGFPLAGLLGAFLWGYLTKRRRPDVWRANRVVYGRRVWGRAPVRLLLAPLYATGFASIPYAWYTLRSGFDFSAGLLHPVAVKGVGWFVFGAGLLGALLLALHFVVSVLGVRAAFLAFGILPADAGKTLDDG
jgi:hypothetical protein